MYQTFHMTNSQSCLKCIFVMNLNLNLIYKVEKCEYCSPVLTGLDFTSKMSSDSESDDLATFFFLGLLDPFPLPFSGFFLGAVKLPQNLY